MKKIREIMLLCTALITLTSVSLKAQQFEWATGWHGHGGMTNSDTKWNNIVSSQTDSQGNLYILGECGYNAEMLGGEELVPNAFAGLGKTYAVVILKMNPQGEILWKKQFFGLNSQYPSAHDLKVVGDSVVMFMINPAGGKISYFLDTVLTSPAEEYWWAGMSTQLTIVGTLDLDGNLIEKHSLQFLYEDNGKNWSWSFVQYLNVFIHSVFCVDNSGNIYIGRNDYGAAALSNLRVIIDNDTNKIFPICHSSSIIVTNPSITKFSPHFDSVIWSRPIITAAPNVVEYDQQPFCPLLSMDCDKYNNIYACGYTSLEHPNGKNYTIFYSENDSIIINDGDMGQSFLIKYDSIGNFLKYSGIKFTQTDSKSQLHTLTMHSSLIVNSVTNSLFTLTKCAQGVAYNPTTYGYFTLGEGHSDTTGRYNYAMFIQYDLDDLHYISHGVAKSDIAGGINFHSTLQVDNNRVFAQVGFRNNLDTFINYNDIGLSSTAFIYWDMKGHVINVISLKDTLEYQSNYYMGYVSIIDSIVYLSGATKTTMYFGEYSIPGSYAYIAKYTDPEFMTPYIYTEPKDTTSSISDIDGIDITIYPNPAKDNIIIQSANNIISDCFITDITGNKYPLQLNKQENGYTANISALEKGLYILTLVTENKIINNKLIKL